MGPNDGRILSMRKLGLLLGTLCAFLLLALYLQTTYLFSEPSDLIAMNGKSADLELPEIPKRVGWPVFDTSRGTQISLFVVPARAAQPVVQASIPAEDSAIEVMISLTAVIVTPSERRALLEVGADRRVVPAQEGTLTEGWRVTSIEPDQITLERGASRRTLYLGDAVPDGH